ncbi:MAG: phosphatase [Bacteroidota bacterium]
MKVAIIDLGTNTFNLLVVNWVNAVSQKLHSSKISVRLGEGGFAEKRIKPDAFNRGMMAFGEHLGQAKALGVEQVYAFATSAVRSADNGTEFVQTILDKYQVKVDVIDGDREAELIYKGVRDSGILDDEPVLIMDIGGGSTEFIIGTADKVLWKESFPLGAARILEQLKPGDPMTGAEVSAIEDFLYKSTESLFFAIKNYPINRLIGSSGSFDSLVDMTSVAKGLEPTSETALYNEIPLKDFYRMYDRLLPSTLAQRYNFPGLIPLRVDFIVIASVFINLVIKEANIGSLWQSAYSLKEGVLAELKRTLING